MIPDRTPQPLSAEPSHDAAAPAPVWTRRRLVGAGTVAALSAVAARPGSGRARATRAQGVGARLGVPTAARKGTTEVPKPEPVTINGRTYDAYLPAADKPTQFYYYTCEFDAAWVILKTYGIEAPFEEQLAITGLDQDPEPYAEETADGVVVYGGEVAEHFCGDYTSNYLAKLRSPAMRKVFDAYELTTTPVDDRAGLEDALLRGELVWLKPTVDFLPWTLATWVTPSGEEYPTVLTNDHAVVAIGFNAEAVVIRDALGPTNTNWERQQEYEVPWDTFLPSWRAQEDDALAVAPPSDKDD